ncbi:hypothetical protein [Flavobacterium sp. SLB02]|uniref:hypothetical protein n=1 Tax=Flavobacterium sp. SLB02 TaxID=2665645 RepID=UPI0012A8DAE5|nr:hypothetical protein [Flavobacterium sp. SLB02]QGK72786.1 hypothetical protein GIY83_01485 [Flavobacterium sp. SLB02]
MIIKNHTIELKDTSASEIARFRQMMLSIWRQQIEDDKNSDKMLKYVESSNNYSNIKFVSVYEVIECIKRKIGVVYPNTSFSKLIDGPINSTPEKLGIINYNDSQGAQKQGGISLEWNTFNGINLIAKTFKPSIEIGKYHTDFSLTIFDNNLKEITFKFIVQDFDLYIALFDLLGVVITSDAQIIINLYLKKIKEANNNPSKLDVIYESLPRTLFGKMNDQQLYEHLEILLSDVSYLEVIAPTDLDTNEDKAILQILYAISDRQVLYLKLRYSDLLYRIYNKLHGEEVQDLLRFLTRLVAEFDTSKPSDIVYFDNSYYLFRDTHIKTDWSGGEILINNYRNETQTIITYDKTYVPMELDSNMGSSPIEKVNILKQYLNRSFNPLAKLNFGTKLGDLGEQIGDENTFVIALKLHNMATKQSNWDLFNKATDLLSLLSAVGALRIVLAKGAPMAAKALAGVVLAKDAAHYAMLSNGTLEKWHENGYGWLANLWIAFSVTADLASFGLPNLSKIAREGNTAAEIAKTAEDSKEIRNVTSESNRLVKAETGKDVSKMNEKQFEKFYNKIEKKEKGNPEQYGEFIDTPENIPGKNAPTENINIKRESRRKEISEETEKGYWRDKDHNRKKVFSDDQLESFVEIELIHETKVRPSEAGEAGDVVGLTGKWTGKTFDAAGLPNNLGAIKGWEHKFVRNLKNFKESIDVHFNKLKGNPPLDKFVLDLRHVDKYPPETKKEIMKYLEENYELYLNNKDKFEIIF